MKKIIISVLSVLTISMLIVIPLSNAADPAPWNPQTMPAAGSPDIWLILAKILQYFFNFVLVMAMVFIIYAGYMYMTAAGDETKIKKALNAFVYALIGAGIALSAKGLIFLITTFFSGTGVIIP